MQPIKYSYIDDSLRYDCDHEKPARVQRDRSRTREKKRKYTNRGGVITDRDKYVKVMGGSVMKTKKGEHFEKRRISKAR